jgi:non-specific serine/threonine protein kinase
LSVFAGSLELDAVEQVCGDGFALEELLDTLTSLVDKSILIREESQGVVRFRLLETLRDYGREQAQLSGEYAALRRRHRDWYQKLALDSDKEWISSRQLEWLARLAREQPNLREAMEFSVSDDPESGLRIAAALFSFWNSRGQFSEGRRWLDRFLACKTGHNTVERAKALYADSVLAEIQGDLVTATALIEEGRELAEQSADSITHALIAYAEGLLALFNGNPRLACTRAETALEFFDVRNEPALHVSALDVLGMAYEQLGEPEKAIDCYERVLAITEPRGESIYRSYALWSMAVAVWRQGDRTRASFLLEQALLLAWNAANPHTAAMCLEALAWIARDDGDAYRAAVLMGAAEELVRSVGGLTALFPNTLVYHQDCIDSCRAALGKSAFAAAQREGTALRFDTALVYATRKENSTSRPRVFNAPSIPTPTKRERQVAALVAEGLTNKEIAARLVISPRTAQGHVEHLLAKLGFTSRAQIAAWVVEQEQPGRSRP